jgi:hypothetical protein
MLQIKTKTFSFFNGKPFKTFCSSSDAEKKRVTLIKFEAYVEELHRVMVTNPTSPEIGPLSKKVESLLKELMLLYPKEP